MDLEKVVKGRSVGPGGVDINDMVNRFLRAADQGAQRPDQVVNPDGVAVTSDVARAIVAAARQNDATEDAIVAAAGDELAKAFPLTAGATTALVERKVKDQDHDAEDLKDEDKAMAVAGDAVKEAKEESEAAAAPGVKVKLSGPAMLPARLRFVFAVLLSAGLGAAILVTALLGYRTSPSSWAFVGTAVLGLFCVIGVIVFVMGYGNVEIEMSAPGEA
jgi:hypothetical protein